MAILYPLCRLFFFFFLPQVSSSSSSSSSWPLVTSTINNSEDVTSEPATRHRRNAHSGTSSYLLSKIWCREKKKNSHWVRSFRPTQTDNRHSVPSWQLAVACCCNCISCSFHSWRSRRVRDAEKKGHVEDEGGTSHEAPRWPFFLLVDVRILGLHGNQENLNARRAQ